jgi:hypothetical protein
MSNGPAPIKACLACFACLALLGMALPAAAKGPEVARSARADALLHQGQALLDAGQVDAACAKFEASESLENGLGTLLHLGDCYERAGRTASAWHAFLEAEAVAHDKKDVEREQVAAQRVSALEPKLTRVLFVVPQTSRVPGLTIQLGANAIPASAWGTRIPVDAGVQTVTASARGYRAWEFPLDATHAEGKQFRVNVPTLSPAPEPAGSNRRAAYRTAGVVTGSFGLAGLGAGAVFNALSHSDDAGTCARGVVQCTPDKSTRNGYSNAATVSFALGGALVATGVTLFVLAPGADDKEKNALRVAARYASGGGRLQLEGAW